MITSVIRMDHSLCLYRVKINNPEMLISSLIHWQQINVVKSCCNANLSHFLSQQVPQCLIVSLFHLVKSHDSYLSTNQGKYCYILNPRPVRGEKSPVVDEFYRFYSKPTSLRLISPQLGCLLSGCALKWDRFSQIGQIHDFFTSDSVP